MSNNNINNNHRRQRLFFAGAIAGLAFILAFAALFSALAQTNPASAQTMQHQGMANQGSMAQGIAGQQQEQQPYSKMFSSTGSSAARGVQVTGVSVTGDSEVTVSLRYTGTGRSPGITIMANTNPMAMMGMMHGPTMSSSGMMMGGSGGMGGGGMMMGGSGGMTAAAGNTSYPMWNSTQWQQWHTQMARQLAQAGNTTTQWQDWHNQMMMNPAMGNATSPMTMAQPQQLQLQVGSTAVDPGWRNGSFKVRLDGDGSAYDSGQIMVAVFPLTG
ncbi:hypothetical protein [Nitrososphaera sp.]|uniref:hypothetical protein n=1 Tax=Nitrososphaera sp. TaxID=1971748 RepID=UPI00307CF86C